MDTTPFGPLAAFPLEPGEQVWVEGEGWFLGVSPEGFG